MINAYTWVTTANTIKNQFHKRSHNLKEKILDPISTMIRLAILRYKPKGTKIRIANNVIKCQEPNAIQGLIRWNNSDAREDLRHLDPVVERMIRNFNIEDEVLNYLCTQAQVGLKALESCYVDDIIAHGIKRNVTLLKEATDTNRHYAAKQETSQKESEHYDKMFYETFQFHKLWTKEQLQIVYGLFKELEALIKDAAKSSTANEVDEKDLGIPSEHEENMKNLIQAINHVLYIKDQKLRNIVKREANQV